MRGETQTVAATAVALLVPTLSCCPLLLLISDWQASSDEHTFRALGRPALQRPRSSQTPGGVLFHRPLPHLSVVECRVLTVAMVQSRKSLTMPDCVAVSARREGVTHDGAGLVATVVAAAAAAMARLKPSASLWVAGGDTLERG